MWCYKQGMRSWCFCNSPERRLIILPDKMWHTSPQKSSSTLTCQQHLIWGSLFRSSNSFSGLFLHLVSRQCWAGASSYQLARVDCVPATCSVTPQWYSERTSVGAFHHRNWKTASRRICLWTDQPIYPSVHLSSTDLLTVYHLFIIYL